MHAEDRDRLILELMRERGFVSFQELDRTLDASPATLRRDLDRLEEGGKIVRVRGGARLIDGAPASDADVHLHGVPFHENVERNRAAKEAIGRAAAALCSRARPSSSMADRPRSRCARCSRRSSCMS